jgi:hypothetical protein
MPGTRTYAVTKAAAGRWLAGLLTLGCLLGLVPHAVGQGQERWLLVFDMSSAMKKRLPALSTEITKIFASNMGYKLHSGDSVGVWTFDTQVHMGQFSLLTWQPADAALVATNLMRFIGKQDFKGKTEFAALQPLLSQVIHSSERLTVLIFADGEGEVEGTPYDDGINENLAAGMAERKKHREPVVVVLRTQQGKFVGATVNYPPTEMTIPPFPQLQVAEATNPPPPVKAAPAPPSPPPVVTLPPLIIVGNSAGTDTTATARFIATNVPARMTEASANPVITNEAANSNPVNPGQVVNSNVAPAPATDTNEVAALPPANTPAGTPTNVALTVPWTNSVPTNVVAQTAGNGTDRSTMVLLTLGGGLFGAAVVLVLWLVLHRRQPPTSLITKLMSEDPRYRK